jgi:hypothetical protein
MADEEKTAAIKKRRKAQSIKDGYPDWPDNGYSDISDMSLAEMAAAFPKDMYKHAKGAVKGIRKGIKEVTGYAKGGKLEMVKKDGKSVPAFAADGVGKMNMGGMVGYKKGGKIDGKAIKGKTKGRMC